MDDEVILGLVQLTGRTDFINRRVFFTRYELLKLLHWTDDSRNYARIEQSLNRWLGVTLYYDKAWWSKEEQCWVNEGFHILDHVTILDRERRRRATGKTEQPGKSSFVWNEVVFNSFKAGYLKQIDFEFYKRLESAVSKRMYRFLDKRFYHRQRLEFELRTFACEHIGLSKNYHNGELKRVLAPAIAELEEQGFLKELAPEERFQRKAKGEWTAVFVRQCKARQNEASDTPELVKALVERGVSRSSASSLVAETDEVKVREKIALFDWLVARKDKRVQRSPAGFLFRAISEDFSLPEDYRAAQHKERPAQTSAVSKPKVRVTEPAAEKPSDRHQIDRYWNAIEREEQERIEQELVRTSPRFLREQYIREQKERGLLFQAVRQAMIDMHVRQVLENVPRD